MPLNASATIRTIRVTDGLILRTGRRPRQPRKSGRRLPPPERHANPMPERAERQRPRGAGPRHRRGTRAGAAITIPPMRDPRLEKLADVMVNYSTGVKRGQLVRLSSPSVASPLVVELYRKVVAAGAHPMVRMS